jgi:hypothetical protein
MRFFQAGTLLIILFLIAAFVSVSRGSPNPEPGFVRPQPGTQSRSVPGDVFKVRSPQTLADAGVSDEEEWPADVPCDDGDPNDVM